MPVGTSGFSDSSFTILYLPCIATACLWSVPGIQIASLSSSMLGQSFTVEFLSVLTFLALIGSIQYHAVIKAIFGPSGPTMNPKETSTAFRGMMSIAFRVDPDTVPKLHTTLDILKFTIERGLGRQELQNAVKFTPILITQFLSTALIPVYAYFLFVRGVGGGFIPILIFMALFTLKFRSSLTSPIPIPVPNEGETSHLEFEKKNGSEPQRAS